jgi:hypothetical protein
LSRKDFYGRLGFVACEDEQEIAGFSRLANGQPLEAIHDGLLLVSIIAVADNHRHAAVAKVEALRAALVAVAQDRHRFAFERLQGRVRVF